MLTVNKDSAGDSQLIIKCIQVQNFRCIENEVLNLDNLTALVGRNGTGKSSFLRALNLFYTTNARVTEEDFFGRNISKPISIIITFSKFSRQELTIFSKYVEGDEMIVEREFSIGAPGKYYGMSLQNPEFDTHRNASGHDLRREYEKLRTHSKYNELPEYTNRDDAEQNLQTWEAAHPEECVRERDGGQFFGFKEVGKARLERFTKFIFIPAVRDAADEAADRRGGTIKEILDLAVRQALAERPELQEFQSAIRDRYHEIMDLAKLDELPALEAGLTEILKTYAPDASVSIDWHKEETLDLPPPTGKVRLVEDDFPAEVTHTGHGLQRAFILTVLQHLISLETTQSRGAEEESADSEPQPGPDLIIGIEEPELYQHPSRERHLANVFRKLAAQGINGVAQNAQIIFSTHSPLFVDIQSFESIRLFRKEHTEEGKPKRTRITVADMNTILRELERACAVEDGSYTKESLQPRLKTLMTPWMNEGFFADVVVLVEGEEDRAAILGVAKTLDLNFESMDITVIPCMGKTNIDRPTTIFKSLEIPVYAVWDGDYGKSDAKPEDNRRLLRLFNHKEEDWPEAVTDSFACFKTTLSEKMASEIGEAFYTEILTECCEKWDLRKQQYAKRNPFVIAEILQAAEQNGKSVLSLKEVVKQICKIKERIRGHV